MNVRELRPLLETAPDEAEVMVEVNLALSRGQALQGTLVLPTRAVDQGTFQSGEALDPLEGKPWLTLIATDAWGISPPPNQTRRVGISIGKQHKEMRDIILSWLRFYSTDKRSTMAEIADGIEERFGKGDLSFAAWPHLAWLRSRGWSVAIHNDYRLQGIAHTFWLFTKGDRCARGEGLSDLAALTQAAEAAATIELEHPWHP